MSAVQYKLQTFNFRYDLVEDRIILHGAFEPEGEIDVYLTRRMLERVLPALCEWLEKHDEVSGSTTEEWRDDVLRMRHWQAVQHVTEQAKLEPPVEPASSDVAAEHSSSAANVPTESGASTAASLEAEQQHCLRLLPIKVDFNTRDKLLTLIFADRMEGGSAAVLPMPLLHVHWVLSVLDQMASQANWCLPAESLRWLSVEAPQAHRSGQLH